MIKFLVCDVDGTLLPAGKTEIAPETINALRKISDRGIKIAIASGRSYFDIKSKFSEISDRICIIANDGAVAIDGGRTVYSKQMSMSDINALLRMHSDPDCAVMLGCAQKAYLLRGSDGFMRDVRDRKLDDVHRISSIYEVKEPIFKLSFCFEGKIAARSNPAVPADSRIYFRDEGWTEYLPRYANKGIAVGIVQSRIYADKYDTAFLGDAINDVEAAKKAKYSVCVGKRCAELASVCAYRTDNARDVLLAIADDPANPEI